MRAAVTSCWWHKLFTACDAAASTFKRLKGKLRQLTTTVEAPQLLCAVAADLRAVNKLNAPHSSLWRVCEEGAVYATQHQPTPAALLHQSHTPKSTKEQQRPVQEAKAETSGNACKLHSANLSLHSQPLIQPKLTHSPVSPVPDIHSFYSLAGVSAFAQSLIHSTCLHIRGL